MSRARILLLGAGKMSELCAAHLHKKGVSSLFFANRTIKRAQQLADKYNGKVYQTLKAKSLWNKIGGFSEEFNPGFGSDPDLNMKLWINGVRIFKCVNKSRVYHFGSQTTRKKI